MAGKKGEKKENRQINNLQIMAYDMQSVEADSAYLLSTCHHINCVLPTYMN